MQYIFSIIIPHFNIPELLMRCLDSIPVREDIQVIVVDDCSPESETYIEKYPQLSRPYLEFYRTEKGGSAGRARNVGLVHALGKRLLFADADDFFADDFESILDEYADSQDEIVYFNSRAVYSEDTKKVAYRDNREGKIKLYNETKDESLFRVHCTPPWGKLISSELVKRCNIRFDETKYSNDYFFSVVTGVNAKTIKIVEKVLYVVTLREGSLSSSIWCKTSCSQEECICRLDVAMKVYDYLKVNSKYDNRYYCQWYMLRFFTFHPLQFLKYYCQNIICKPQLNIEGVKAIIKSIIRRFK